MYMPFRHDNVAFCLYLLLCSADSDYAVEFANCSVRDLNGSILSGLASCLDANSDEASVMCSSYTYMHTHVPKCTCVCVFIIIHECT